MKAFITSVFVVLLAIVSPSLAVAAESTTSTATGANAQVESTVNINTADATTLTALRGIGQKKAEAIVAWREANGSFKTVDQLLEVKGIGEAILEANREKLRLM